MNDPSSGIVVQLVLPTLVSREQVDEVMGVAFMDVRETLYGLLESKEGGKVMPQVILRDFRFGGNGGHYV